MPLTPTITAPIPLAAIGNTALRDSIATALGQTGDKGYFMIAVDNKGGGVVVAKKWGFGPLDVDLVAGARYGFDEGMEFQVKVVGRF